VKKRGASKEEMKRERKKKIEDRRGLGRERVRERE
jgi:hypothetical protein